MNTRARSTRWLSRCLIPFAAAALFAMMLSCTDDIAKLVNPPAPAAAANPEKGGLASVLVPEDDGKDKRTALDRPEGVLASKAEFGNKIIIVWNAVTGADYYTISKRKKSAAGAPEAQFEEIPQSVLKTEGTPQYQYADMFPVDTMDLAGLYDTYEYNVQAFSFTGLKSPASTAAEGYLLAPPRDGLVGSKNAPSITISWGEMRGAEGFRVYRSNSKSSLGSLLPGVFPSTVRTFRDTDSSLAFGTEYYYYVVSVGFNGSMSAPLSPDKHPVILSVRVRADAPQPPSDVKASKADFIQKITLEWTAVNPTISGNTIRYNIYKNSNASSRIILIKEMHDDNKYEDADIDNIEERVLYNYFVQPIEIDGSSGQKILGGYSTDAKTPDDPSVGYILSSPDPATSFAKRMGRDIVITWKKALKASGYEIYKASRVSGPYSKLKDVTNSLDENTYTDSGGNASATDKVFYKILSVRTNPALKTTLFKTQPIEPLPDTPTNVKASRNTYFGSDADFMASVNRNTRYKTMPIKIEWSATGGAAAYTVWRSESLNGDYVPVISNVPATKLYAYDSSNKPVQKYFFYKVSAQNSLGANGELSAANETAAGYGAISNAEVVSQFNLTVRRSHQKFTKMHRGGLDAVGSESIQGDVAGSASYNASGGVNGGSAEIKYTNYVDFRDPLFSSLPYIKINGKNNTDVNTAATGTQTASYTVEGMYGASITADLKISGGTASGGTFSATQTSGVPPSTLRYNDVTAP